MRVEDILNEGYNTYKKQFAIFIVATVIAAICSILIITAPPLLFGLFIMGQSIIRGEEVEIKDVFKGFDYFVVSWMITIIAGFLIILGFIFFIIPGIILISFFQYAIPIAIGEKLGSIDSLKKSYRIGRDNFQFSIILGILMLVINSIGTSLGVVWIITYPFTILCLWIATRELTGKKNPIPI